MMIDVVDKVTRSRMMAGIRSKDTQPEMRLRRFLHAQGFRYKLHDKTLPGKPDLVFPRYRAIIEVNGCFWHKHHCPLFKWPRTRAAFWYDKINANVKRDEKHVAYWESMGWRVLIVWECSMKGKGAVVFNDLMEGIIDWLVNRGESGSMSGFTMPDD